MLLALFLMPAGAWAFGSEETFRGDEFGERGYLYDEDYFTKVLDFSADKEWLDRWAAADNGLMGTAGSVATRDFYLREEVKLAAEVIPGSTIRYSHIRSEDFDSRYQSTFFEWEQDLGDTGLALSLLGQVSADKENDDVGLAATYRVPGRGRLRVSYILPDFTWNSKAPAGEDYTEKPRTLRIRTDLDLLPRLTVVLDAGRVFPVELESASSGLVLRYRRTWYRGLATWRLQGRDQVWLACEGESAAKGREGLAGEDIREEATDRSAWQARLEYLRYRDGGGRWALGGRWFRLDERNIHPRDPGSTLNYDFTEYTIYGGYRTAPWREAFLEARLYLAAVDDHRTYPADPGRSRSWDSPQATLALSLGWEPGERVALLLSPSFDLDAGRFGGGNLQLLITF